MHVEIAKVGLHGRSAAFVVDGAAHAATAVAGIAAGAAAGGDDGTVVAAAANAAACPGIGVILFSSVNQVNHVLPSPSGHRPQPHVGHRRRPRRPQELIIDVGLPLKEMGAAVHVNRPHLELPIKVLLYIMVLFAQPLIASFCVALCHGPPNLLPRRLARATSSRPYRELLVLNFVAEAPLALLGLGIVRHDAARAGVLAAKHQTASKVQYGLSKMATNQNHSSSPIAGFLPADPDSVTGGGAGAAESGDPASHVQRQLPAAPREGEDYEEGLPEHLQTAPYNKEARP